MAQARSEARRLTYEHSHILVHVQSSIPANGPFWGPRSSIPKKAIDQNGGRPQSLVGVQNFETLAIKNFQLLVTQFDNAIPA